jgi:colanic acid biosynthesis glycosyl transferase WcaI
LDAAEALRDEAGVRLLVVGDGRAAPMVRREIERRGLQERMIMLGRFPLERMPAFFGAADALLVSLGDQDAWSMTIPGKVQSYLSAGKPLLGMMNGEGARVIEESGAGLVAPAGDGPALATKIREMKSLPAKARSRMGSLGQAYCKREFNRGRLLDAFETWVEDLRRERQVR